MSGHGRKGGSDKDNKSHTWEFVTRFDKSGNPVVIPTQALHYPPNTEFDDVRGLRIPPPPATTPRGENSESEDDRNVYKPRRHLTVTPVQIVNQMNMLEAFSDAVSRTYRPHADTISQAPPNPDSTFTAYIPFPYDFQVVPDPLFVRHTWVQTTSDYLFYSVGAGVIMTAVILSLSLFATLFVHEEEIYSKQILKMVLEEGTYVNVYVFIVAHFSLMLLFIVFLCYPHRDSWGRFHKMRWIPMGIVNIIMVVAVLDQFHWLVNFGDLGEQLKDLMSEGLDVTTETILTSATQVYFRCCGVDGYADWEPLLNHNRTIHYGGYPKSCCSDTYIKSCSIPINKTILKEPSWEPFNQLWPKGCYISELRMLHVTIILIWIVLLGITFTSVIATLILWWVIRHINIHDLTTDHPFLN